MSGVRLVLSDPHGALAWLQRVRERGIVSLDDVEVAQVFAVAAIAALARQDGTERLAAAVSSTSGAGRFAHAVGFDEVIAGAAERDPEERDRTVSLTRVRGRGPKESISEEIVRLVLPPRPETTAPRDLFRYVLV